MRRYRYNSFRRANEDASMIPASAATTTIQRKTTVGKTDDPLEHEADRTADKIMRMPERPFIQRKGSCSCGEYDDDHVHLKPLANHVTPFIQSKSSKSNVVSNTVSNKIQATKGQGNTMQGQTKSFMESRFDRDFSDVHIHTDNDASQMSKALNAQAFTVGRDIYFNDGKYAPDSKEGAFLLAHELVHTLQQGKNGIIRRAVTSHYGDFKDESYKTLTNAGKNVGVEMYLKFHANDNVDAKKIAMLQSVRTVQNGATIAINGDATITGRMIKPADAKANSSPVLNTDEGTHIDQLSRFRNPLYATGAVNNANTKLPQANIPHPVKVLPVAAPGANGELYSGWGVHGFHYKIGRALKEKDAELHDAPTLAPIGKNSEQLFETTALAISGNQEGTYYGSVEWGWRTDASNTFTQIPLTIKSNGTPTSSLLKSAEIWNKGTSSVGKKNIALPVEKVFYVNKFLGVRLNDGLMGHGHGPLINDWVPPFSRVNILKYHNMGPFLPGDDLAGKVRVAVVDSLFVDIVGKQGWLNFSDLTNERP